MATEATETPVILYETLAPLGDSFEDQFPGFLSLDYHSEDTETETPSQTLTNVVTPMQKLVVLQSSSLSSVDVNVEGGNRDGLEGREAAPSASEQLSIRKASTLSEHQFVEEPETVSSKTSVEEDECSLRSIERAEGNSSGAPPISISQSENEEIGFLSFDAEASVDTELEKPGRTDGALKFNSAGSLNHSALEAPPWAQRGADTWFKSPFLQLHQEIVDFCNFVTPTEEEQQIREAAVQRIREVVKSIWPSCQVKVFGSFATGLYLPTSDCDVVILESGCQVPQDGLKALAKALNRKNLVKNLQVIGKARVPIVKFVETESNVNFDISFDVANGPEAADFIKNAMTALPPLKPLCLVIKIFLQQRELNEVYTGGIGSYALLVMLLTHLQMHPSRRSFNNRGEPCPLENNLGILLVDFFDFYGRALNVRDVGISCRSGGRFYCKRSRGFLDSGRSYLISVEDPQTPDNDIGKNSYNITKVRSAFVLAHRLLTKLVVDDVPAHVGLLGRIVRMDTELMRRKVVLPEMPQRLYSAKRVESRTLTINASSSHFGDEPEVYISGISGHSRWQEDEAFPRGGEAENLSSKRKRGKDKADRFQEEGHSPATHRKHKRKKDDLEDEPGVSSLGKSKRSRHRKDSEGVAMVDASSMDQAKNYEFAHEIEKPGLSDTIPSKEKTPRLHRSSRKDTSVDQSLYAKKNKRSKRHQREDSHEEGEITVQDDAAYGIGNGHNEGEQVFLGAGNGYNNHKRWFSEGRSKKSVRLNRDHRTLTRGGGGEEDIGGNNRRVILTKPGHKKIKYL